MKILLLAGGVALAAMMAAGPAAAEDGKQDGITDTRMEAGPQHAGHVLVLSKCFQCHTDAMYRDLRQDRRAWEATVYRMIGRGALWTSDEVRLMADYLGSEYGPASKPATLPR